VVQAAAAESGGPPPDDLDPEAWWQDHGDGSPLGYSNLLASLAATPAARRALLAGFFEPTDDDRQQGMKVPGPAHRAIATLVRRGAVRVIVTTNFDRLIEQALEAEGIFPQVIATPSAIAGMEPLAHARCTVVKLHGDYARIDQLNTVEELSHYEPELQHLLSRILDEYGLIINGWSGDWDHALVAAIEGLRSRRYPLYWATYGPLGSAAKGLVAQHRALVIEDAAANQFFPDLDGRVEALEALAAPPLSTAMAVARLKRSLPDPTRHIEVRDLFETEIGKIRSYIASRGQTAPATDGKTLQNAHEEIRARCDTLLHLFAQGVYLDRDRQHTALWVWVIEQVMRARTTPVLGNFTEIWINLNHYPAALVLKAGTLAAIAARHDDVMLRMLREPTGHDQLGNREKKPAVDVLHDWKVLNGEAINNFPRSHVNGWIYPVSHFLREELRAVLLPLVGDEESYVELFSRTEFRTALAQALASVPCAPGEFIGHGQWTGDSLKWETDFRATADREAWSWTEVNDGDHDPFDDMLARVAAELKAMRRWG
jgi:hypothetical protein